MDRPSLAARVRLAYPAWLAMNHNAAGSLWVNASLGNRVIKLHTRHTDGRTEPGLMNQVCRCCLAESPAFAYNIFHQNLRHELSLCVPSVHIEPDDGLPEVICDLCLLRLRESMEFRRRCEENDRELRKRYDETNRAIEQALGLNLLGAMDVAAVKEAPAGAGERAVSGGYDQPPSEMGVAQMLEDYTSLEMAMLDDLMLSDPAVGSFSHGGDERTCSGNEEDPLINELLAKFLNEHDQAPQSIAKPAEAPLPEPPLTSSAPLEGSEGQKKAHPKAAPKSTHPCPQCEKKFTRNFQLKLHLISAHGVGSRLPFRCVECSRNFASRHSLNYHQMARHRKERPFVCPHCQRSFVLRTQLEAHLRVHSGQVKPRGHACPECGKSCSTRSDLKTHLRTHDPCVERPFKCQHCEKAFFTRSHLKSHELVHTGEKPHKCALCNKAYQNIGNLNNHLFRSHAGVLMGTPRTSKPEANGLFASADVRIL